MLGKAVPQEPQAPVHSEAHGCSTHAPPTRPPNHLTSFPGPSALAHRPLLHCPCVSAHRAIAEPLAPVATVGRCSRSQRSSGTGLWRCPPAAAGRAPRCRSKNWGRQHRGPPRAAAPPSAERQGKPRAPSTDRCRQRKQVNTGADPALLAAPLQGSMALVKGYVQGYARLPVPFYTTSRPLPSGNSTLGRQAFNWRGPSGQPPGLN